MKTKVILLRLVLGASTCLLSAQESNPRPDGRRPPGRDGGLVKPSIADTLKLNVYADNWFVLYINGKLVAADSATNRRIRKGRG